MIGICSRHPTDANPSNAQRAQPVEPEASLRAELLAQISDAQGAIEAQLEVFSSVAAMGGDSSARASAQHQLQHLSRLQHRVDDARGASLASIRNEVMASVAATQFFVQQARATAATAHAAEIALHAASAATHREVTSFVHDFYEKKIFDPYLRFASAEDEEAYRKREAERREAIAKALAEGTPQGNLRAAELSESQLRDAGAHGADKSPDYQPMLDRIAGSKAELSGAIAISEASKGPSADPLDAVHPDRTGLDPAAGMRAAGVTVSDTDQADHGVSLQRATLTTDQGRTT